MAHFRKYLGAYVTVIVAFAATPALVQSDRAFSRGEYLARIMDCGGCHTPGVFTGKPDHGRKLAGSEIGGQAKVKGTVNRSGSKGTLRLTGTVVFEDETTGTGCDTGKLSWTATRA